MTRIAYLDAMRGFTMLLVVYGHVLTHALQNYDQPTTLYLFFERFRMPLFFFISGYIAYKATNLWDVALFKKMIKKKALVQLVPTAVFFLLYSLMFNRTGFISSFKYSGVGIYWFCQTLFEMFVPYYITQLFCRYTSEKFFNWIIIALIIITKYLSQTLPSNFEASPWMNALLMYRFAPYFMYFGIGLLCSKYKTYFLSLLKKNSVFVIFIVLYVAMFILHWNHDFIYGKAIDSLTWKLIIRIIGVMWIFALFLRCESFFAKNGRLSTVMQFVGRRTLDIYLIHYFIIPDLSAYNNFIMNHNTFIELVFGFGVSAIILSASLAISAVLRKSNFLAHYLFGAPRSV